jgi:DNA-directed RNA polymerase specialized sigma24 family protein
MMSRATPSLGAVLAELCRINWIVRATPSRLKKLSTIYGFVHFTALEPKELLELLAERIGQLPEVPKGVLAMCCYEDLRLADIAACFNVTKTGICQIHTEAVNELRKYVSSIWVERGWNEREDDFSAS